MSDRKPGPKLTPEQRNALLGWLAAEYAGPLIRKWFVERAWPDLSDAAFTYYRDRHADEIAAARQERRASAINTGLALKEERVRRLAEHADELEAIKWVADEKTGRLWNEKAWRETLDDIAKEMGHRKQSVELSWREKLKEHGHNPDELKQQLVAAAVTALRGADGSADERGDDGSPGSG